MLVVDTNTHIERFWRNFFFYLVVEGTVLVCLSKQIYDEMSDIYYVRGRDSQGRKRKKKFNLPEDRIREILSLMLKVHSHGRALWDVPADDGIHESVKGAISDKDDYHVIELARRGGAGYIITHDQAFPEEYEVSETGRTIKSLKPLDWLKEMLSIYESDDEKRDKFLQGLAFACALTNKIGLDDALSELGIDTKSDRILAPHMPRLRVFYKKFRTDLG